MALRIFSAFSARRLVEVSSRRRTSSSRKLAESISASWALLWGFELAEGGERAEFKGERVGPEGWGEADIIVAGDGRGWSAI